MGVRYKSSKETYRRLPPPEAQAEREGAWQLATQLHRTAGLRRLLGRDGDEEAKGGSRIEVRAASAEP